jgi:Thioesterase-like superfamily
LQRTAAAADFGNGVSRILDFETHVFINPDLTVSLSRVPAGEWIGFDVVTRLSPDGYGQAESLIFDRVGPAGRATQSLLVEER